MTRRKLKPWVKYSLAILLITFIMLGLIRLINNDMERHIEKVSKECAEQGYGIIAIHGNDGEKHYVCNK